MTQCFECEKLAAEEDGRSYIKLIIYIVDEDSTSVWDITHHDTEQVADDLLAKHWKIPVPSPIGTRYKFESQL
jgi:hypothetical protein